MCKVMILNGVSRPVKFKLDNDVFDIVTTCRYLGVILASKFATNLFKEHYYSILKRAKIKAATLRTLGFSMKGFWINTSIRLYELLVKHILEICAQTLNYELYRKPYNPQNMSSYADKLEHFQTQTLKTLLNCPRSTCPSIVRLFCGIEPLACSCVHAWYSKNKVLLEDFKCPYLLNHPEDLKRKAPPIQ